MNMKIKTIDIAKKSGVSVSTVSRYFNHPELLSEKTIEKIEQAIKETDYSQDPLAKAMITGNSDLVGVILPELEQPFFTEFLSKLEWYSRKKNIHLIVHISNETAETEKLLIKQLCHYRVKGIILMSQLLSAEELKQVCVPLIAVGHESNQIKRLNSDYFSGGWQAGKAMIENGCQIFACVTGNAEEWKLILGFEQSVKGYPYLHIENTEKLLQLAKDFPERKIGVLCVGQSVIRNVLAVCREQKIEVPSRIEVVGYGEAGGQVTTIEQDIPLMAQLALEALNNRLVCESLVPVHIVHRATTSTVWRDRNA